LFREYLKLLSPEYLNFILNNYVEGDLVIAFTLFYYRVLLSNKENLFVIFSSDQDYIQLLDDDVIIFNPRKSMYITKENMNTKTKYNSPEELFFIKLLHGDKSDNIKGIQGIGNKR
jgi:DNA polymerase-1